MFPQHEPIMFPTVLNGVIDQSNDRLVRVKALGSIWNATLHQQCQNIQLTCGQSVMVVGRCGIRLIIATPACKI